MGSSASLRSSFMQRANDGTEMKIGVKWLPGFFTVQPKDSILVLSRKTVCFIDYPGFEETHSSVILLLLLVSCRYPWMLNSFLSRIYCCSFHYGFLCWCHSDCFPNVALSHFPDIIFTAILVFLPIINISKISCGFVLLVKCLHTSAGRHKFCQASHHPRVSVRPLPLQHGCKPIEVDIFKA
jgi:hypothetical protein